MSRHLGFIPCTYQIGTCTSSSQDNSLGIDTKLLRIGFAPNQSIVGVIEWLGKGKFRGPGRDNSLVRSSCVNICIFWVDKLTSCSSRWLPRHYGLPLLVHSPRHQSHGNRPSSLMNKMSHAHLRIHLLLNLTHLRRVVEE